MMVFNRTHLWIFHDGRKWAPNTGILRVVGVDTGAKAFKRFQPVAVAHVASDADDHPSGLTVARTASQILYQTAAIRKLEIQGSSFCQGPALTFQPPLTDGVDYSITRATAEKLSLTLKPHKKWRYEAGPLLLDLDPVRLRRAGRISLRPGHRRRDGAPRTRRSRLRSARSTRRTRSGSLCKVLASRLTGLN